MNKIFHHREFAESYLLQFVSHVGLLDIQFSPTKLHLFLCRMSEKNKFIH